MSGVIPYIPHPPELRVVEALRVHRQILCWETRVKSLREPGKETVEYTVELLPGVPSSVIAGLLANDVVRFDFMRARGAVTDGWLRLVVPLG